MIEDEVIDDMLERLYGLAHTAQQQGAEKIHHATRDAAETIMLLQAEIKNMKIEYDERYQLTTDLVVALKQYVVNAEGDPVLGPAIKQWVRLVRYDG